MLTGFPGKIIFPSVPFHYLLRIFEDAGKQAICHLPVSFNE